MTTSDWIVIGAGIAGASCAYFLAADGHQVTLLERGGIASGTSSAGQNNIGVPLGAGAATPYFQAALGVYASLRGQGFDLGFKRHGHLYVARDGDAADALRRALEQPRLAGVAAHLVLPSEFRDVEPRLSRDIEVAVLMPDGAQVSPMQTVFELVSAASRLGARIVTGAEVRGITMVDGRPRSVETASGSIRADGIVIAAGVWSQPIGQLIGLHIPVFPRRGQVLVTEPAVGWLRHCLTDYAFDEALMAGTDRARGAVLGSVIQPLPRGNLLIGGSLEDAGFDRSVDRRIQSEIARLAVAFVPDIAALRIIRTYAGLRPATADGWPIVGACPELPGVMLATGHGGGGIDGGPVAGRLVADLIAGRSPVMDPRLVSPERFGADLYRTRTVSPAAVGHLN